MGTEFGKAYNPNLDNMQLYPTDRLEMEAMMPWHDGYPLFCRVYVLVNSDPSVCNALPPNHEARA